MKDWISQLEAQLETSRPKAIDMVYNELDLLLWENKFDEAKKIIHSIAQSDLPLAFILSALTASYPWRQWLKEPRKELIDKATSLAIEVGGEAKVDEISLFLV
jgi:hypothetical protein